MAFCWGLASCIPESPFVWKIVVSWLEKRRCWQILFLGMMLFFVLESMWVWGLDIMICYLYHYWHHRWYYTILQLKKHGSNRSRVTGVKQKPRISATCCLADAFVPKENLQFIICFWTLSAWFCTSWLPIAPKNVVRLRWVGLASLEVHQH